MMSEEQILVRNRVAQWGSADPVLRALRDEDTRKAETAKAMKFFTGAVLAALPDHPPVPWSGLVEQQRWFSKMRSA